MIDLFFNISLIHYLILSLIVFVIGLFGILISKNLIRTLMCIELMFVSININLIAFAHYLDLGMLLGESFAIFVMSISAIEAAIGISILIHIYKSDEQIDIDKQTKLGGGNA